MPAKVTMISSTWSEFVKPNGLRRSVVHLRIRKSFDVIEPFQEKSAFRFAFTNRKRVKNTISQRKHKIGNPFTPSFQVYPSLMMERAAGGLRAVPHPAHNEDQKDRRAL